MIRVRARMKGVKGYLPIHRSSHYNPYANPYALTDYSRNEAIVFFGLDILSMHVFAIQEYLTKFREYEAIGCMCRSKIHLLDSDFTVNFSKDSQEYIDIHTYVDEGSEDNCHGDFLIELDSHMRKNSNFDDTPDSLIDCFFLFVTSDNLKMKSNLCWHQHEKEVEYVFKSGDDKCLYITCKTCYLMSGFPINYLLTTHVPIRATRDTFFQTLNYLQYARHNIII